MTPTSPEEDSPSSYHPLSELLSEGQECSGLLLVEVPHPAREALAWKAGARGCLWRGQPCERLLAAVRQALAGTSLWTPGAVR
jgi:DNA-binding NarL/FixJ family response regulator